MIEKINLIKQNLPETAKDLKLSLENVLTKNSLDSEITIGIILTTSYYLKEREIFNTFAELASDVTKNQAKSAATLMAATNVWYSYGEYDTEMAALGPGIRMNVYANFAGGEKLNFEIYALASSILGKCKFCIANHIKSLKELNISPQNLADIGRITAVINSLATAK